MEHIAYCASALCNITLDSVGKRIHTGCGGKSLRHRRHHFGINNSNLGDIVYVNANKFALFLNVGDNVVDGNLGGCTGGCGDSDCKYGVFFCRCNALKTTNIGKFGVVDDNTDSLCGIHSRAAADCYDTVGSRSLVCFNAALYVFDCRVSLYVGEDFVRNRGAVKHVKNLFYYAETDKVGVGTDKGFFVASCAKLVRNFVNCARAMVRNGVKNNAVCHN